MKIPSCAGVGTLDLRDLVGFGRLGAARRFIRLAAVTGWAGAAFAGAAKINLQIGLFKLASQS